MKKVFITLVLVIFVLGAFAGCQKLSGDNDVTSSDNLVAASSDVSVSDKKPAGDESDTSSDNSVAASSVASASNEKPQATAVTEFEYRIVNNQVLITRFVGDSKNVVIPSEIESHPVVKVIDKAFANNGSIISVTLPETLTAVELSAFANCAVLAEVKMPNGVTSIGQSAFENCEKLSSVVLPESLEFIGAKAFYNCKNLKKINIPKNVSTWREAFCYSGLEEVEFAEGLESIGDSAFMGTKLKTVKTPKSLKKIGWQAFAGCSELESIKLNDGLTKIGGSAFDGKSKLEEIIIPASVQDINELAFSGCSSLKAVKFEGNAPEKYKSELPFEIGGGSDEANYTVYYHKGAKGFTSGEWCGYPTAIW